MSDITSILSALASGNAEAAAQLLPLVYDELRTLAAQKLAREKPGQTLDATALVHEAYLRLVGNETTAWAGRRHFFLAAAEAMRRILVDNARRKNRLRHGGALKRVDLPDDLALFESPVQDILAVDEALEQLAENDPQTSQIVKLHFFGGLTIEQAAESLGLSTRTAYRDWNYARAWLFRKLGGDSPNEPPDS